MAGVSMRKPVPVRPRPARPPARETACEHEDPVQSQIAYLESALGSPADLVTKCISDSICLAFLEPIVDATAVRESVLEPLCRWGADAALDLCALASQVPVASVERVANLDAAVEGLLDGKVALMAKGCEAPFLLDLRARVARQIAAPISQPSVRGPRDSFTERLSDNLALIRQRVRNRDLRVWETVVGSETRTRVAICYIEGKASQDVADTVKQRLSQIDMPHVLDSSDLLPYIAMRRWMLFPPAAATERADRAAAGILNGRIVVVCDNSPFILVIPVQLLTLFHASEDHYNLSIHSVLLRTVRAIGWFAATIAPGLYVGLASFNPGILPPNAIMTLAAARHGVPYPPIVEVLIMDIALEMLAEASARLPTYIGGAAMVVGGLVLGTAAAEARLVSTVMIVVVAVTAIGSFAMPDYQNELSWRAAKYLYTFFAAILGIYGLATAGFIILVYLCSMDVLGVPYLSPFAPWRWTAIAKDTVIKVPAPLGVELEKVQRKEEAEGTADAGTIY